MKFAYTTIYVPDVAASLTFFERAFGFKRRFLHESGTHFPTGHVAASDSARPLGIDVAIATTDVVAAHSAAVRAGATELAAPKEKAWGQAGDVGEQVSLTVHPQNPAIRLYERCAFEQRGGTSRLRGGSWTLRTDWRTYA